MSFHPEITLRCDNLSCNNEIVVATGPVIHVRMEGGRWSCDLPPGWKRDPDFGQHFCPDCELPPAIPEKEPE